VAKEFSCLAVKNKKEHLTNQEAIWRLNLKIQNNNKWNLWLEEAPNLSKPVT